LPIPDLSPISFFELFELLKRFEETDNVRALGYAGVIDQVCCSIWAVNFVSFNGLLETDAAFLKIGAAVAVA